MIISVRDEFSSGGLKSLARIFVSIACMKKFARILPDFLPENSYMKNYRGAAAPSAPWAVRLCAWSPEWPCDKVHYYKMKRKEHTIVINCKQY